MPIALNHTYDLASRLTEVSSSTGLKQYTYNQLGYLATAVNGRNQTSSYGYDDAGRLTSKTDPDGTITSSYDANGNLLTVTDTAGTITRVYDALNRVTSYTDARGNNIQYQYDEAGNLTVITYPDEKQVNYSYDAVNRLTGITDWASRTTEYSYDANTTSYVINPHADLSQVLMKTDPDDTVTYYVYGLGLVGEENEGSYKSYHYDLRGSTVALTDLSGVITDSFQYGIYGEVQRKIGSAPTLFLFNGKYGIISDNNGLYFMRARYYSLEIMRFTRQDDLIGAVHDPLSLNRHAFVKGNPVRGIDPTGYEIQLDYNYYQYLNNVAVTDIIGWAIDKLNRCQYFFDTDNPPSSATSYARLTLSDIIEQPVRLNDELNFMIATVYGESTKGPASQKAIANVIMNRVGTHEWYKYHTVTGIIKNTGFDGATNHNVPYMSAINYLNNRDGSNNQIEELIRIVTPIYYRQFVGTPDSTKGAVLYYSPKTLARLHEVNPRVYPLIPSWVNYQVEEIKIGGTENDDFIFFKYK